jgi:BirA family biotin operon repressor/biotin-[acetyl-CoA-carboxylase] ligase
MNPLFTGKEITELESVDSTNSYAIELLKHHKLAEGHVVWAKQQLQGRGQRGNTWESEAGSNVTASVIFFPTFLAPGKQFQLTQAISLGVCDFLSYTLDRCKIQQPVFIKWPNDLFVNNRKIAGILIENSLRGSQIAAAVAGIGINVNQTSFNAANGPVSLKMLTGESFDIRACIDDLCAFLEPRYLQLRAGKTALLNEEYLSRMYRLGEWSYYKAGDHSFPGRISGVADDGKLLVEMENGDTRAFDFKEIAFL